MYEINRSKTRLPLTRSMIPAMLGVLVALIAGAGAPPDDGKSDAAVSLNDRERAFSEKMTNVVMTGRFTTDGRDENTEPEKYQIQKVTKIGKDQWLILAKISYGGQSEVPAIPIPVKIQWAGDTPVLSLTDLTIPGFGTFTSRVMFFEDRYAGTWQHGASGGHIFGTIAKAESKSEKPDDKRE